MARCVIYNPAAGRGLARRQVDRLRRRAAIDDSFWPTDGPGHAEELALRAAADGYETILAAGGDGTVHEAANGVLRANRPDVVFAPWPVGSANDYAYALNLPADWPLRRELAQWLRPRLVDAGRVTAGNRTRFFVNGLGLGFNSAVTLESRSIPGLRGMALYGLAFLRAVMRHYVFPPITFRIDDRETTWPTLAFTLNLGRREGGFLVAPKAALDDGLFDYVHAGPLSRLRALALLPRLATGTLPADHPLIHQGTCRTVQIRAERPLRVHLDGEFFCQPEDGVRELKVELLPAAFRVLGFNPAGRRRCGSWIGRR